VSVTVVAGQTAPVRLGKAAIVPAVPVPAPIIAPPPVAPPEAPTAEVVAPAPPPDAPPEHHHNWHPQTMAPVWTGVGVSVVGFATAIIFGAFKSGAQSSYNGQVNAIKQATFPNSAGACVHPQGSLVGGCSALSSDGNDVNTDATVANVGIAAGVIGGAFALGWYFWGPRSTSTSSSTASSPHLAPMVGPRVGGLTLGGSF
jgi:hypothetical protein